MARLRVRHQRARQPARRQDRHRAWILRQYGRLQHQSDADSIYGIRHLCARVRGRAAQYAARRRHRHRVRHHSRLRRRHFPPVVQLAAAAAGRRLRGIDPQPAAPVPDPVLVSRRAGRAAGSAPEHFDLRRGLHQQSRPVHSAPVACRRLRPGPGCVCRRVHRQHRDPRVGAPAPGRNGRRSGPVDSPRAHRRLDARRPRGDRLPSASKSRRCAVQLRRRRA